MVFQVERFDREHLARKTSLFDNMRDVYMHKWAESDPVIRAFDRQAKCKHCGEGHWTVSCPLKKTIPDQERIGDNYLVEGFLVREGDPEPEDKSTLLANILERFRN